MRTLSIFLYLISVSLVLFSQVPSGIPYQAVIRNNEGNPLTNTPILIKFTLHDLTPNGSIVYQENQSTNTSAQGIVSLNFGGGASSVGTFSTINWGGGNKFLQVETNIGNGFVDLGTQQLMSVPYALFSGTAAQIQPSQQLQIGEQYQGGTIFYLDKSGQHGFVIADTLIRCYDCRIPPTIGLLSSSLHAGKLNTSAIKRAIEIYNLNPNQNPITIIESLNIGGYNDWFIPSWDELLTAYLVDEDSDNWFDYSDYTLFQINSSSFLPWADIPNVFQTCTYNLSLNNFPGQFFQDFQSNSSYCIEPQGYNGYGWAFKVIREF